MRTISLRLDTRSDRVLRRLCAEGGRSQTDVIKDALQRLDADARATPAELANALGLVGAFASREGDLARAHARHLKDRLAAKAARARSATHRAS